MGECVLCHAESPRAPKIDQARRLKELAIGPGIRGACSGRRSRPRSVEATFRSRWHGAVIPVRAECIDRIATNERRDLPLCFLVTALDPLAARSAIHESVTKNRERSRRTIAV